MLPTFAEKFLSDRYGGKRAWLSHLRWKGAWYAGRLHRYAKPSNEPIERIVFVCTGNICRSAYAHERARMLQLPAESCGTHVGTPCRADPFATIQAARRGVDLSGHISKPASAVNFCNTDLVAVMEPRQAQWLHSRLPGLRITLLGAWSPSLRPYLQDPYGRGADYFHCCFQIIDEALEQLTLRIHPGGTPTPTANDSG